MIDTMKLWKKKKCRRDESPFLLPNGKVALRAAARRDVPRRWPVI